MKRFLSLLVSLTCGLAAQSFLCSCQIFPEALLPTDVAALPPEALHGGYTKLAVLYRMGEPDSREPWTYRAHDPCGCPKVRQCYSNCQAQNNCGCSPHSVCIGEIWHYRDEWHRPAGWADNFGSWDLYFGQDKVLAGWKSAESLPSQGHAEVDFVQTAPSRAQINSVRDQKQAWTQ